MKGYNSVCHLPSFSIDHPEEDPMYEDGFWSVHKVRAKLKELFNELESMDDKELMNSLEFTDTVDEPLNQKAKRRENEN